MNSGQICMSTDRIIIHKSLVETFVPRYVERVKALPVGDRWMSSHASGRELSTSTIRASAMSPWPPSAA
jgi:benzaldehyde dehydrogenase (NAD)